MDGYWCGHYRRSAESRMPILEGWEELIEDAYSTLGVREDATPEELRRAYQQLARQHHPDRAPSRPGIDSSFASDESFRQVQAAWEVVRDPTVRRRYDAERRNSELLDAQLAARTVELDLGEMEYVEDATGKGTWCHDCRCGDLFEVTEAQLNAGIDTVACRSCSLVLRPLYQKCDAFETIGPEL